MVVDGSTHGAKTLGGGEDVICCHGGRWKREMDRVVVITSQQGGSEKNQCGGSPVNGNYG